ncbi:hypothetical protein PCANC_08851 [Puccinia coronata f. sp. avenae]|uniref:Uncharacterized protein n=1 Tax=Puccinia coronata f. sp. avenae TaxID=200324 RepID=A0A2N5SYQ6_9BASI|nr:hypothetical protein PCANC_08851 [Puccinia coronata f. sp. avenae]
MTTGHSSITSLNKSDLRVCGGSIPGCPDRALRLHFHRGTRDALRERLRGLASPGRRKSGEKPKTGNYAADLIPKPETAGEGAFPAKFLAKFTRLKTDPLGQEALCINYAAATRKRLRRWTLKVLIGSIIVVFSLSGVGRASGRPRIGGRGRADNFEEKIVCRASPIRANRTEILKFIDSFCAEAMGQEFGGSDGGHSELKELYTIEPSQRGNGMANHVLLHLKSINGCKFFVDYSCGRFLSRPTDECNIGDEAKQGGYVVNGCSLWKTIPLAL